MNHRFKPGDKIVINNFNRVESHLYVNSSMAPLLNSRGVILSTGIFKGTPIYTCDIEGSNTHWDYDESWLRPLNKIRRR